MSKIIAVDFDGTCVTREYPEVGADIPHAVEVLKKLNNEGVKIIVWTMRCGEHLDVHAKEWFENHGIEVWAYNSNPEQSSWTQSPKCYAQAYIDDAAIGCPLIYPVNGRRPYVDYIKIEKPLEETGFLESV